jgi:hypothetical protein
VIQSKLSTSKLLQIIYSTSWKTSYFSVASSYSFQFNSFSMQGKMIKSNPKSFFISYWARPINPTHRPFTLQPKPSSSTPPPCRAEWPRGVHAAACSHADKARPRGRAVQAKRTVCVLRPTVRSAATSLARPTATTRRAVVSSSRQPSSHSRSPSRSIAFAVVSSVW